MHASTQPNGRSPKQISGSMSSSQLKPGTDNLQNVASLPYQGKGKKRERADHSLDPIKRERSSKMGEGDSGRLNSESLLKSEIAKVVERGALVDTEDVDRLVQVMVIEVNEKKVDLPTRTMLTNIIISTEKSDLLSRFVHIRGLSVLDEWLQDVHKGKISDSSSLKDNDKVAEEFLLVLLRALDKLPVNLHALQMCNIGKSVNHLRTHKNLEIQKKARSLVDTWKKRVEAEMNMNDSKMGSNQAVSWSTRSRLPEVAHVNRNTGGSSEGAPKSPIVQLSESKTAPAKLLQGETASKSASQFQGSTKSASPRTTANINLKDGQPHIGSSLSNVPSTTSEKSNSSSPSHNSNQTCSGDHVKNGGSSVKEDARSSAAALNKISCLTSRHRKSVNSYPVSVASAREAGPSRTTSLNKNVAPDKASQSGFTSDKASDVAPEVNSHKFIVKIPNRSRSPGRRAVGGSIDDSSATNSRPPSPVVLERPDQLDAAMEGSSDASQANASLDANAESWQRNDFRDSPDALEEGNGPDDNGSGEEHLSTNENTTELVVTQSAVSSPRNIVKQGKVPENSMSPMNALIESCVNYAKAEAPVAIVDDVGMHLLASVAAGEMIKSELASPTRSPNGIPSTVAPSQEANDSEMKPLPLGSHSRGDHLPKDVRSDFTEKDQLEGYACTPGKGDDKTSLLCSNERLVEEEEKHKNSSCTDVDGLSAPSPGSSKVTNVAVDAADADVDVYSVGGPSKKNKLPQGPHFDGMEDTKVIVGSLISPVNRVKDENAGMKSEMETEVQCISSRGGWKTDSGSDYCGQVGVKQNGRILSAEANEKELKTADGMRAIEVSEMAAANKFKQNEKPEALMISEVQTVAGSGSGIEEQVKSQAFSEKKVSELVSKLQTDLPLQDMDVRQMSRGCEVSGSKEAVDMDQRNSSSTHASVARVLDRDTKLEFDLNEGLSTDDGKFGEPMNFNTTPSSALAVPLVSLFPSSTSLSSASLSAPVAVSAAATKGPFVPPDDLLRAKVEIGWKGSAATSAFRPAEPRKGPEMPATTINTTYPPDISLGKHARPPLDFDLNVADERIIEDAAPQSFPLGTVSLYNFRSNVKIAHHEMTGSAPGCGSGGLGLDLNRANETSTDVASCSIRNIQKVDGVRRDFDLNNEPVVDASEPSISGQQQLRSTVPAHQPPLSGLQVNGAELGNFSTWFHAGSSYSAVPVPTVLSDRGEQSFPIAAAGVPSRMAGPSGGGIQFNPEIYRSPVLSSSPGLPFLSAPFQYSVFPYGNNFPLPSATLSGSPTTYVDPSLGGRLGLPPVHSQLLGAAGAVTSHFSRPYMVSLSDGSGNNNIESSKKWSRQGLDLNMGSGGPDLDGRDETSFLGPKQLSIGGPKSLAEEQARMNQMNSGLLKRKEAEGGWDGYRQSSWQQ